MNHPLISYLTCFQKTIRPINDGEIFLIAQHGPSGHRIHSKPPRFDDGGINVHEDGRNVFIVFLYYTACYDQTNSLVVSSITGTVVEMTNPSRLHAREASY